MIKKLSFLLLLLILCFNSNSQDILQKKVQFGVELDVLPYVTGGYFGAGWIGKDLWRLRILTAYVKKPDWSTKKEFSNHQIEAYALVVDRFLEKNWKGWWAGTGLVYWHSTIQTNAKIQTANFNNLLINGSLGYHVNLFKHCYLSPWASLNLRVAGNTNVPVDDKSYSLPLINPEASLKFGYYF
jgi:hypothetical protein